MCQKFHKRSNLYGVNFIHPTKVRLIWLNWVLNSLQFQSLTDLSKRLSWMIKMLFRVTKNGASMLYKAPYCTRSVPTIFLKFPFKQARPESSSCCFSDFGFIAHCIIFLQIRPTFCFGQKKFKFGPLGMFGYGTMMDYKDTNFGGLRLSEVLYCPLQTL